MKERIFTGVGTALITPFKNEKIDYPALKKLIERQIEAGIDALIIGGTTGEAATLEDTERYELFERSREYAGGRCKLIFGTGTNDTRVAIKHTRRAAEIGCDGVLLVTPYYNKGTSEGIYRHYTEIAKETSLPVLLYNVPSRTGVNLELSLLERLAAVENIVGIKEAADSQDRLTSLSAFGDRLYLYAGNDSAIYSTLALGGLGVISVVSNLYPKETLEICKQFFAGNLAESLKMQNKLLPVINSLFKETNPAPIKYAMSQCGLCSPEMRLPMWLPTESTRRKIDECLAAFDKKA